MKRSIHAQGILKIITITILILGMLWYLAYQARNLLLGPQITLRDISVTQDERTVTVNGTTRNITELSMNGKTIYTDESGVFNEKLVLENGYTIMTIHAKDRYGRAISLSHPFVYTKHTN
jgi:hypothetical protein